MHDDTPPRGTVSRLISRMTREENRQRRRREEERRWGDCAGCIKKRRRRSSPSFAAWSTFRLIRLSATNLSVLSPYAFCHPPSSPSPSTFFFHSIFLPSFDVPSLSPSSPLLLNPSCSISPSSSRLGMFSAQMNI